MILNKYNVLAETISDILDNEGTKLRVIEGTPLAELMAVSVDALGNDATTAEDLTGTNRHDIIMEGMIDLASKAVTGALYRARQVVKPLAIEIAKQATLVADKNAINQTVYTITRYEPSLVHSVPAWQAIIEQHGGKASGKQPIDVAYLRPSFEEEELLGAFGTGVSTIDHEYDELLKNEPSLLQRVLDKLFVNTDVYNELLKLGKDGPALGYILARGLLRFFDEINTDNPDSLRSVLAYRLADLGNRLLAEQLRYERAVDNGLLVRAYLDHEVVVNDTVYDAFLKAGGTPEVLMGAALKDMTTAKDKLLAQAEMYVGYYRKHVALQFNDIKNSRRVLMQQIFSKHLYDAVKNEEAFEGQRDAIYPRIGKELALIVIDTEDCYPAAVEAVARILYPNTPALRILKGIDDNIKNNPTLTPRDAVALVMRDYVCDWLRSQVTTGG